MKTIALLIFSMFSLQSVKAQQVCKDYITDEWSDSRYIVENISGDNIVTDTKTGLMWKQCSEGLSGADCMTGTAAFITWQEALVLADTQNISGFAGYFDWRLPNVEELRSLTAINCYNPSINEYVFPIHNYILIGQPRQPLSVIRSPVKRGASVSQVAILSVAPALAKSMSA